jgi:cobalt/nickel transport system ATP-binding protein
MRHLTVKQMTFGYESGIENRLFKGLDFTVTAGETIGLIGPNGAGKSTLLQLLLGILKAESGEIALNEVVLDKKSRKHFRETIGLVFQNPDEQLFMPTVYDDVAFGPRNQGLNDDQVDAIVMETLLTLGIHHLSHRLPSKLSGGEKRCAAIATVLAMKPKLMILDEPTLALDPKSRRRVIQILKDLPITKIITSHDMEMIKATCTRVVILNKGEILAEGDPFVLLDDAALMERSDL